MKGHFRDDYKAEGAWAPVAEALNRIGRCLNHLVGMQGVRFDWNSGRGSYDVYASEYVGDEPETLPWEVSISKVGDDWKVTCAGGPVKVMLSGAELATGITDLPAPGTPWAYVDGASVYVRYYHRGSDLTWSGIPSGHDVLTLAYGALPSNTLDAVYVELARTATVDGERVVTRRVWNALDIEDAFRGQIKLWDAAEAVPEFWEIVAGLAGRFPVGAGGTAYSYALKATGGYDRHGVSENDHGNHVNVTVNVQTDGTSIYSPQDAADSHGDSDNRPPFYAVHFIRRT